MSVRIVPLLQSPHRRCGAVQYANQTKAHYCRQTTEFLLLLLSLITCGNYHNCQPPNKSANCVPPGCRKVYHGERLAKMPGLHYTTAKRLFCAQLSPPRPYTKQPGAYAPGVCVLTEATALLPVRRVGGKPRRMVSYSCGLCCRSALICLCATEYVMGVLARSTGSQGVQNEPRLTQNVGVGATVVNLAGLDTVRSFICALRDMHSQSISI